MKLNQKIDQSFLTLGAVGKESVRRARIEKWLRILLWRSFCNFSNVLNRRPTELNLVKQYSENIADRAETRYRTEETCADGSLPQMMAMLPIARQYAAKPHM